MAHDALQRSTHSTNALDPPSTHHKQSQSIDTVALRNYLKEVYPPSLTTFPLSTLNETLGFNSFTKLDISHTDWELEEMFGSWNSTIEAKAESKQPETTGPQ